MVLIYFVLFILGIESAFRISSEKEQKINPITLKFLIFSIFLYVFELSISLFFKILG